MSLSSEKVTHFVSWCWAYSLNDVVSSIERWLQKSGEDPLSVFLWMCFFCNNQYRIKEEAPRQGKRSGGGFDHSPLHHLFYLVLFSNLITCFVVISLNRSVLCPEFGRHTEHPSNLSESWNPESCSVSSVCLKQRTQQLLCVNCCPRLMWYLCIGHRFWVPADLHSFGMFWI